MVQEILTNEGDVLKFSGDAFLSMWKRTPRLTMQQAVHTAIDCGIIIQKNYGTYHTDAGVVLKVKVAISAGLAHFAIIGGGDISQAHYVLVGQPVWDVKMAEYQSIAGDVLTSPSAWKYVNETDYCTEPCEDGKHTKVLGVGAKWKRVEKLKSTPEANKDGDPVLSSTTIYSETASFRDINYREFALRPAVVAAMRSTWWANLRPFMVSPVLRAVDNDEPMDFLTEVRRVVVVFLNIITKSVTANTLIRVVDTAYKLVCSVTSDSGGLVNKVSMFDKDMMFLVVFGLRGLKDVDEAQNALQCAFTLRQNLDDRNIIGVSIGVTSGKTYCGVVGHLLRREYTVIGSAVNKAARLMIAYPDKVTCDKETFLQSKLDQTFFRLMKPKPLKGIPKPGPIYEFNRLGWSERPVGSRHPILGRGEELGLFQLTLENALKQRHQSFTRYRDHKYAFAIIGPTMVGKSRLLEECLNITPSFMPTTKITMCKNDMNEPYALCRELLLEILKAENARITRQNYENKIRRSFDMTSITPLQIYAVNIIFGCRFPLPENFTFNGDLLQEHSVRVLIQEICKENFTSLWVVGVEDIQFADDDSWRVLLIILETKTIFLIVTLYGDEALSLIASECLANNMIVKVQLSGIDRWYHAALACQLLDVQAIPADLEKVIQSASGGLPGWIQNFVISLVQLGDLTVVTVPRDEAVDQGAVMPPLRLLQNTESMEDDDDGISSFQSIYSTLSTSMPSRHDSILTIQETVLASQQKDMIQMAILTESYNFENMKIDIKMDAVILKTYDSLTPFEKMLLKCGSVLGDVFSRRMLRHLLQSDSPRKVAEAVAKLFKIRVLECEGGDFTRDASLVLIHPVPALPHAKPPYCACLVIRQPANCRDLPMYAFCGYMKFRYPMFRTTTYDLLTEKQKREMHARALLYLERYTRRCAACYNGCFTKLLGLRCNDGLLHESKELIRTREQIRALNAEMMVAGEQFVSPFDTDLHNSASELEFNSQVRNASSELIENKESGRYWFIAPRKDKRIRSFTSLRSINCECLPILLSAYCQLIDHCRGAGEYDKLFEAYLEYADLSVINLNVPQAIRLLFEVETLVKSEKFCDKNLCKVKWINNFRLARIYSLRGACMLESGDLTEARKQLFHAMTLYYDPFPSTKNRRKMRNMGAWLQLILAFKVSKLYIATEKGVIGQFYEEIATTLNYLYRLFTASPDGYNLLQAENKEWDSSVLTARWSLIYALKTNSNFRVLCISYGNLIVTCRQKRNFSMCMKLEKRAMEVCHRKRGQLDVTEVHAVCYLYTSIFLFYVEFGQKVESLEFGISVLYMITNLSDLATRQMLILCMLRLLLSELRINDMVSIMREFLYMTDQYDLSSVTWYYSYAMVVLLDTGYCVETYDMCERFYIKKGDTIFRTKTPEAAWNFFVCMWLITIRLGAWERSIVWEDKINKIISMKFEKHEFNIIITVRLTEGLLITLVEEMDNRNVKKILFLNKTIKTLFQDIKTTCKSSSIHQPRYLFLLAYYNFIKGKKRLAFSLLHKALTLAKRYRHMIIMIWCQHTRSYWKGTLSHTLEDYWIEHLDTDNLLDYRDFDKENSKIVPYTLPLPRDLHIALKDDYFTL